MFRHRAQNLIGKMQDSDQSGIRTHNLETYDNSGESYSSQESGIKNPWLIH